MLLKLSQQPLTPDQQQLLRQLWGRREELKLLKRIVAAKAALLEAEAMNDVATSAQFEKYSDKALATMKQAEPYRHFLKVLEEIETTDSLTIIPQIT